MAKSVKGLGGGGGKPTHGKHQGYKPDPNVSGTSQGSKSSGGKHKAGVVPAK